MNLIFTSPLRTHLLKSKLLQPVTTIIVNYNAGTLLSESVGAALDQAQEVIVVDNASKDGSMELLEANFVGQCRLKLMWLPRNQGFAVACNHGMAAATFDFLLFLNPDCLLGADSLLHMVAALESNSAAGMAGGRLINPDGSEQGGGRRAVPTPWRSFVRAFGLNILSHRWPKLFFDFHLHEQPLPTRAIEVEAISGALMLVRRSAVDDVGFWDEAYFLHCEDLDWCMRFRQREWTILFVPDAPVVHYLGHSSKTRPFFVEWHKHKGMIRFYTKFFSHQYPGVLMWLVRCGVWFRFGVLSTLHAADILWGKLRTKRE